MIFKSTYDDLNDQQLITASLSGNKQALTRLIQNHQNYIYNISLKLFLDPEDAKDATQEVIIKVITHLKTFKGKSQFRTWLYRITFNHFLAMPKQKMESLETYKRSVYIEESSHEFIPEKVIEEVRILCSTAMLMCLNREQRLLYIIGEVFNADHQLGATLFNISPQNYRVRLYRAKKDLFQYVSGRCGLIDSTNPCRCPKKTKILLQKGIVDKATLRFNTSYRNSIKEVIDLKKDDVSDRIQLELAELFRETPFQIKKELDTILNEVVSSALTNHL
ncbi:hypothetical protein GCM10009117_04560 [Gangjinia marincola]|uniref:RNA polymerase sigma-70 region 2 domain-containing protein n=1 Tax=Gangjinia marincola TaxID=578463 RepID=A0ABP3XPT2_9FLAO